MLTDTFVFSFYAFPFYLKMLENEAIIVIELALKDILKWGKGNQVCKSSNVQAPTKSPKV